MLGRKNIRAWIECIKMRDKSFISRLESIYGENKELIRKPDW